MIEENAKAAQIITKGKDLFWKFGINRVTVEEICREAGVSKMTFYKFFKNKNKLAIEIIKRIFDENIQIFKNLLEEDIPYEIKMQKQIQLKLEKTQDISEEFVKDIYGMKYPEVHAYWEKRANESIQIVIEHYKYAQKKGWIRKDIKIDFILYMINKSFEFTNDDDLISKYNTMQDLIMEFNKFFLYGILPRNSKTG